MQKRSVPTGTPRKMCIRDSLQIDGLGVGLDGVLHLGQIVSVDKGGGHAELGQDVYKRQVELMVGRTTSDGSYTVLVTTSLMHVSEAGEVMSTVDVYKRQGQGDAHAHGRVGDGAHDLGQEDVTQGGQRGAEQVEKEHCLVLCQIG